MRDWLRLLLVSAISLSSVASLSDEAPKMKISTETGRVRLVWEPDMNADELTRIYTLYGRAELGTGEWEAPIRPWHRFFKVEVKEPTGEEGEVTSVSGVSFVPRKPLKPGEQLLPSDPAYFEEPRTPMPYDPSREYGYVQLWADGPEWAECNLGATSPEEAGDGFWWGETTGVYDLVALSPENCASYDLTAGNRLITAGFVGTDRKLVPARDAARQRLGIDYRMPTDAEFAALTNNCTFTHEVCRGVAGMRFRGKGVYADKSIFFPAVDENGTYWTSVTPNSSYGAMAFAIKDYSCDSPKLLARDRFLRFPIRAVRSASASAALPTLDDSVYEPIKTEAIGELLTTKWDQMPPYNLMCPFTFGGTDSTGQYNGARCATGCMTTALAQILNYHKYPAHGYGAMTMPINQRDTDISFYAHTYNWAAMKPDRWAYMNESGSYSESDPSVQAVAQLMYDVGVATRQSFGGSSGGANIRIIPALLSHFNYDSGVTLVKRESCSGWEEWDRMIIDELKAGRPVYIEGLDPTRTFGHAFVCDGYDGNGKFHINWGWSGLSNGDYDMRSLNPAQQGTGGSNSGYSTGLFIVRGIRPRLIEGEPKPELISSFTTDPSDGTGMWSENGIYIGGCFTVTARLNIYASMGLLVVRPDGSKLIVQNEDNGGAAVQILDNNVYRNFRVDLRTEWCRNGTRLYYIYKPVGTEEWKYIPNRNGEFCGLKILCDRMVESGSDFAYLVGDPGIEIEEKAKAPEFPISFDPNTSSTRLAGTSSPRYIGTIALQESGAAKVSYQVDPAKVYRNMTEEAVFACTPGATITPFVTMAAGSWMSAYFYIDYGRDGNLSYNADRIDQQGTDAAAFSFWTGDEANGNGGRNSAGVSQTNGNTLAMPSCRAPTEPGEYKIRFKIDWNCIDPAGNSRAGNTIIANGGAIVDATLVVR